MYSIYIGVGDLTDEMFNIVRFNVKKLHMFYLLCFFINSSYNVKVCAGTTRSKNEKGQYIIVYYAK